MYLVSNGYGSWSSRDEATSLSDQLLCSARALGVASLDTHSQRHLPLLFNLFHTYASLGISEKHQLLRVRIRTEQIPTSHRGVIGLYLRKGLCGLLNAVDDDDSDEKVFIFNTQC